MERYKLSIIEGLRKYKKVTINLDLLMAFAVGLDVKALKDLDLLSASKIKLINSINLFDFPNFSTAINQLCNENILVPYGRETTKGIKKNYRVVGNQRETERDKELTAKIMSYQLPGMEYYTRKLSEFRDDKPILDILNDYYKQEKKPEITANELGVLLFRDEKAFEQLDPRDQRDEEKGRVSQGYALTVINKLRINLKDKFNAEITIEPFFYKVRASFYKKMNRNESRNIIIIENKDTYYTFYRTELGRHYDMIIYGEGNKINSSFSLAADYDILKGDNLYYFGDIDPVGFAIYARLRNTYKDYEIQLAVEYYKVLIQAYKEKECSKIRREKVESYMMEANNVIRENDKFNGAEKEFLDRLMVEKRYIPQEAIAIFTKGDGSIL